MDERNSKRPNVSPKGANNQQRKPQKSHNGTYRKKSRKAQILYAYSKVLSNILTQLKTAFSILKNLKIIEKTGAKPQNYNKRVDIYKQRMSNARKLIEKSVEIAHQANNIGISLNEFDEKIKAIEQLGSQGLAFVKPRSPGNTPAPSHKRKPEPSKDLSDRSPKRQKTATQPQMAIYSIPAVNDLIERNAYLVAINTQLLNKNKSQAQQIAALQINMEISENTEHKNDSNTQPKNTLALLQALNQTQCNVANEFNQYKPSFLEPLAVAPDPNLTQKNSSSLTTSTNRGNPSLFSHYSSDTPESTPEPEATMTATTKRGPVQLYQKI